MMQLSVQTVCAVGLKAMNTVQAYRQSQYYSAAVLLHLKINSSKLAKLLKERS